jgi:hypothetical protein
VRIAALTALDAFDEDMACRLVDGTQIHPKLAIGSLAVATLRRLVMTAKPEILDLGESVRCFPSRLRDAIKARDRGRCQMHDGCDAPHQWLDTDHITPYAHFGATSTANGRMGCEAENRDNPRKPSGRNTLGRRRE